MNCVKYDTFAANADLQWIVLHWSGKSITNDNKYNEYKYNPAAIKFQCIFAWLIFVFDCSRPYVKTKKIKRIMNERTRAEEFTIIKCICDLQFLWINGWFNPDKPSSDNSD